MGHHIDLGRDGIAAPDDDQIGLGDLAGIDAVFDPDPGEPAGIRQRHADGGEHPRIAHGMAQPLDPVALHQPHGAGIEIGPDGLAAMAGRGALEGLGHLVQRRLPGDRLVGPDPLAFRPDAAQGKSEAIGVVLALGIAGDLGADHPRGIAVPRGAPDLADARRRQALDLERAGARAIMRADGGDEVEGHALVPGGRQILARISHRGHVGATHRVRLGCPESRIGPAFHEAGTGVQRGLAGMAVAGGRQSG